MRLLAYLWKGLLLFATITAICGFRMATGTKATNAPANNFQAGAQIVAAGTTRGAVACARCHGYDGASDGSGAFPILTGQSAYYLTEQLRSFASGTRQNALMTSIAAGLTEGEMQSVAQYYASARPTLAITRQDAPDLVARGQQIATVGNLNSRVQACASCHGPNGTGEKPAIPYISGQYKHYIEVQLQMFQRGYRKNAQMWAVGHHLTGEEATAVAAYFDQLPLPTPQ
jgi:cytochrome c553